MTNKELELDPKQFNYAHEYRVEDDVLINDADSFCLIVKLRNRPKRNQTRRYLLLGVGSETSYLSGMFPDGKNKYSIEIGNVNYKLELLSPTKARITEVKALQFEGGR